MHNMFGMASVMSVPLTPFSGSPDPTTIYLTASLRAVLYKTRYAIEHRQGLAAILGEPGLGKSTLMRYLYAHFMSQPNVLCAFIPNPDFTSTYAMQRHICMELGAGSRRSLMELRVLFQDWLIEQSANGINVVLFLDEAQKLDSEQLELCRTMLNFETDREKLVQVVLAGNLDLRNRLKMQKHRALLSRIFAPSIISPMTPDEIKGMLQLRCDRDNISFPFEPDALKAIYEYTDGVPRLVLRLAEFSYAQMRDLELQAIHRGIVEAVIDGLNIDE